MIDEAPSPARTPRLAFWRTERRQKFLREVGSVVLGVLIALGLGAIAGEIGWKIEVATARNAMEVELGELIGQGEERENAYKCVEDRLDQLSRIVDAAETAGKLPPLGAISMPPWRTWPRGIWASTVSAQTASHLDRDLLDNYSSAYVYADNLSTLGQREIDVWTDLTTLVGPGRAFSTTEAVDLRRSISKARVINRMMAGNGIRLKQIVTAYDLGYDLGSAREYSGRALSAYEICAPIPLNIPATYGQAPGDDTVKRMHATPITRESGGGAKR